MADTKASWFLLPEYDVALKRFIHTTLHALMRQKDPVLGMIPTERSENVTTTQNTMPSGEVVKGEPLLMDMRFEINTSDVLDGNVEGFLASIDAAAEDGLKQLMPQIFGRIGALAEAADCRSRGGARSPSMSAGCIVCTTASGKCKSTTTPT